MLPSHGREGRRVRFGDVVLAWAVVSDFFMYTLHVQPLMTVHLLAPIAFGLYVLSQFRRPATPPRPGCFPEFGPGPWNSDR